MVRLLLTTLCRIYFIYLSSSYFWYEANQNSDRNTSTPKTKSRAVFRERRCLLKFGMGRDKGWWNTRRLFRILKYCAWNAQDLLCRSLFPSPSVFYPFQATECDRSQWSKKSWVFVYDGGRHHVRGLGHDLRTWLIKEFDDFPKCRQFTNVLIFIHFSSIFQRSGLHVNTISVVMLTATELERQPFISQHGKKSHLHVYNRKKTEQRKFVNTSRPHHWDPYIILLFVFWSSDL